MKQRIFKLVKIFLIAALLSGGYAFLCMHGIMIPCVFHEVTGLRCPGCGVTHMCLSLLHLDFVGAFAANQALFILLPVFVFLFISIVIRYIRTGRVRVSKIENIICISMVIILIPFAILRNIFLF